MPNNNNKEVYRLYNGIDTRLIKLVRADKRTWSTNNYSIVYVTGFGPWSRAIETMETVTKLRTEFPNIDLTMIGSGVEEANIIAYIEAHGAMSYIHFLGYIRDRKVLFENINRSAIGLNISDKNKWRDAAHPMKVMEYTAMAKKVVSTNLAEVEKLGFKNIFIFSDNDAQQNFEAALRAALHHKDIPSEYDGVASKVLNDFDWTKIISSLEDIINKARQS